MKTLTTDETRDYDKRRAAIHEAGHVVVAAIHDKLTLSAFVGDEARKRRDDSDTRWQNAGNHEHVGLGQTYGFGILIGLHAFGRLAETAVAGVVAEMLMDDPEIEGWEVAD